MVNNNSGLENKKSDSNSEAGKRATTLRLEKVEQL